MPPSQDLTDKLHSYANRIEADLRKNILPFWMERSVNPKGSFFGSMTNELQANPDSERGALLTSRILWTFSAAYEAYREKSYLEMADYAYEDLIRYYLDKDHGGFFWSINADGSPRKTRKQVYGQAFAIYAMATYYRATESKLILDEAVRLFELIEARAKDPVHGGYFEAFDREWKPIEDMRLGGDDLNAPKSQNTHLHIMEAYTALLEVWPDPRLQVAHRTLVEIMLDKVLDKSHPHLGLFFKENWECWNPEDISYGHDIEAAWLLDEAAWASDDPELIKRVQGIALNIANSVMKEGIDTDGAILYEGRVDRTITCGNKEWWPHVEAIMGYLTAARISGEEKFLEVAFRLWDYCESKLIDKENGGWFRGTDRNGILLPGEDKISFWKCPYHNGRCGMEAPRLLRKIAQKQ